MVLFRNLQCRTLMINGSRTSIALEPQFWTVADKLSRARCISWQAWASNKLTRSQSDRASVLRVAILEGIPVKLNH